VINWLKSWITKKDYGKSKSYKCDKKQDGLLFKDTICDCRVLNKAQNNDYDLGKEIKQK
jgi:hypothetical protein